MGICPDFNTQEWKLLVQEMPNSVTANEDAYKIYVENGYKYPDHIVSKVNVNVDLKDGTTDNIDPKILDKKRIVEKAIDILTKKIARVSYNAKNNVKSQAKINELTKILIDLKRFQTDAAIIEFIRASDRMVNGGIHWLNEMESGDEELTNDSLAKIKDYIGVFDILEEIQKDSIKDEKYQPEMILLDQVIGKKKQLFLKLKELENEFLINQFTDSFEKVKDWYKREAEKEFLKTTLNKDLKGKDKDRAKKEFIRNYMIDNDGIIQVKTRDAIRGLLTRAEDIPWLTSMFVNPRDVNNPQLAYALKLLDKADFNVNEAINTKTREINDLYQKYREFMGNKSNVEELYEPLLDRDSEGNLNGFYVHSDSGKKYNDIKTGKYKGTIVEELYDTIIKLQQEKDSYVTNGYKLGYRIPRVNKSTLERIYAGGILTSFKEGILDKFRVTATDTDIPVQPNTNEAIEVITDESGREKKTVPVHYRGVVELKDQSYDILTLSLLDLQNTLNFKEKSEVGVILNMLKDNIAENDIIQRNWQNVLKIDKYTKSAVVIKGINSNLYKNMEDLIRHRVYGISVEGDPQTIKVLNSVSGFVSTLNMSLNYLSAGANMSQGIVMEWIESIGGETGAFGRKNRLNAYLKYHKDLPFMVKDLGEIIPTSKTNLLAEKLQINSLWSTLDKKFIQDNLIKKVGTDGVLHSMTSIGENHLQAILMYSVLDNIKVLDKNGDYLDKDFKPTKDRDKAIGYDEAHTFVGNELVLNSAVTSTELTKGVSNDDILKISKYIQKTGRSLFGNYDPQNKAIAQRTIIGHMVMQMRGWLIPGIQKRWRGLGKAFIDSDKLTMEQMSYSAESGRFEEGQYVTTIRFIKKMAMEVKALKLQTVPENWNKLTDDEKANIKKTLMEAGLIVAFLMIATSLKDVLDDDKEKDFSTLLAAYYSRRLFSELFTYANPKEGLRTFKSPAVALGTVEDSIELLQQFIDYDEEYKTGKHKGELKIGKKFKDLVPIYKQYDKDIETSLLFLEK